MLLDIYHLFAQQWPILLPVCLGGLAVYWLLPRARPIPEVYGALAGALALCAAGWWLIHSERALAETLLFFAFAGMAVLFGGLMITQRNAVHAALCFAMVVLSTCGLFLLQAAPFLMAATIIVYAGAIVVTFLFVIMLAQQAGLSTADHRSREPFLATVAGFVLLASLLFVLTKSYSGPFRHSLDGYIGETERALMVETVPEWGKIFSRGDTFFTNFRRLVSPTNDYRGADRTRLFLRSAIDQAESTWNALKPFDSGEPRINPPERIEQFKRELAEVRHWALVLRQGQGSLTASDQLPLSTSAGASAKERPELDPEGKPLERLPAANVAGLGSALFTDYLLAVELAGTLLLVATIGAIAISGRRLERLR